MSARTAQHLYAMKLDDAIVFSARVLLAQLFLESGFEKIGAYAATQGYMESMGVPGWMLPMVILLEVGGGVALVAGFLTRWVALAFAAFSIAAALLFHLDFAEAGQSVNFMKNFAIAGGMLLLYVQGAGGWALDAMGKREWTPAAGPGDLSARLRRGP